MQSIVETRGPDPSLLSKDLNLERAKSDVRKTHDCLIKLLLLKENSR
jgi:hypothetical protein